MHTASSRSAQGGAQDQQLCLHATAAAKVASDLPEVKTYFQTGGLVDSVVNQGKPAPIDIRVGGSDQACCLRTSPRKWRRRMRDLPGVSDVLIPQDLDYPGLQLNIKREKAARLGSPRSESSTTSSPP